MRQINKNVAPAAGGPGSLELLKVEGLWRAGWTLITLKGHLLLAPRSAALSLQVTEWGGFRPSCALREPRGYKKRRRRAAGRRRRRKATGGKAERREKRQQVPDHPLTDASMGSATIAASFLLFLAFQLPGQTGANPVYGSVSNADLMDFKVGPGKGHGVG